MRTTYAAPLALVLLLPVSACSNDGEDQTLTVLAAASLTETFTELAARFEDEHPGVDVRLVLGSSTTLAEQAGDGAPGDVLATADEASMRVAEEAGALAGTPEPFASNRLTLVTPPDDPAGVSALADLDRPDVDYVVCVATAPCGAIARPLLEAAGVSRPPASEEVDVKAVLARVVQGEADAGLVYRTDAIAAGDEVAEVVIEDADAFATSYVIAPLRHDSDARAELAAAFVTLVRSTSAQRLLEEAGFGAAVEP